MQCSVGWIAGGLVVGSAHGEGVRLIIISGTGTGTGIVIGIVSLAFSLTLSFRWGSIGFVPCLLYFVSERNSGEQRVLFLFLEHFLCRCEGLFF